MTRSDHAPAIRVGLLSGVSSVRFALPGCFKTSDGQVVAAGEYSALPTGQGVHLEGATQVHAPSITLEPATSSPAKSASSADETTFTVHDVTIGIGFHWERAESQAFEGKLILKPGRGGLLVINELPLEQYLGSVVSSEMSGACPRESLRAHAIVSRSWLLAQFRKPAASGLLNHRGPEAPTGRREHPAQRSESRVSPDEIIRWYDREAHEDFDVCADDHCQRYQGITKSDGQTAFDAVRETRGKVLLYNGEICDARYSKCCGGMTEVYRTAWEDREVPYLASVYDGPGYLAGYPLPLTSHCNAGRFIDHRPFAYCDARSEGLLTRILAGFDQETRDFYRWDVRYTGEELAGLLASRMGADFGRIRALEPVERGPSGRILRLRIVGEKRTLTVGKELEIRRVLSLSHLYSSAFIVRTEKEPGADYPGLFRLSGAGWGHGVGLCQIGAAVMADLGHTHEEILSHYFRNTTVREMY